MPTFTDFTFPSTTGKNTIHARKCVPDGEVRGVVQIAHGIAEYIDRYDPFLSFLAENGFVAVGNDHLVDQRVGIVDACQPAGGGAAFDPREGSLVVQQALDAGA